MTDDYYSVSALSAQPQGIAPGVYYDLSEEDYHADPALSSSGLKLLLPEDDMDKENPMEYWENSILNSDREPDDTAAMKYGRAYHTLLLQPETFNQRFIVLPSVNDIKIDSEVWAKLRDSENGQDFELPTSKTAKVVRYIGSKTIISEGDYNAITAMRNQIMRSPQLSVLLGEGMPEVSVFWRDEETGVMCRVRFDWWAPLWIIDVKSIAGSTSSKRKLRYESLDRGYHISAAMYVEGLKEAQKMGLYEGEIHNNFILLFQGKKRPYTPRLMRINDNRLAKGHEDFRLGLQIYKENIEKYGASRWSDDCYLVEDLFNE